MPKYDPEGGDPYLDPSTGILSNRVGAVTEGQLADREAVLVSSRSYELETNPEPGGFDLAHLRRIHVRLFQDVYAWAGELRTVEVRKGNTLFARRDAVVSAGQALFDRLAAEGWLRGLEPGRFAARAGFYLGEINVLHPFRDGNGRAQRAFIGQLAIEAGHMIDWERMTRAAMVDASIAAYNGDAGPMATLIERALATPE